MTLYFYIAKRFLVATFYTFLAVLFLATLFDSLELARRAGDDVEIGVQAFIALAAMRAPSISIVAAPYAVLIAAMWTFARLARSSELVVARAAGVSSWGVATPTLVSAALIGVFVTMVYNPVAAALLDRYERLQAKLLQDDDRLLSVSSTGLWLRQGNKAAQTVIHALKSNSDGTELQDVEIFLFEGQDNFVGRIDAASAKLEPGYWRLDNAVIRRLEPGEAAATPERRERDFYDLPTDLTPDQIIESFAAPETIPIWRLPDFIDTLEEQGFSARRHRLYLHTALAAPLVYAAMTLLGAAFSMRHARFGGLGMMALYAALTGFVVYFVFDIAKALGGSGIILVAPAAWGPPIAALMFAAGLLLHFEDG